MRAIMLMFDTLSRRFLSSYGADWTKTPNFKRLEEHCVVFDNFYSGSLPCMPARRELHTGRYNFMHRAWGPLEPFDESMMEHLKEKGIYTHLVTDHYHYFEDGGATYHNRYCTWEGFRGQEGDRWQPRIKSKQMNHNPWNKNELSVVQHYANRTKLIKEEDMPSVQTINAGLEFLEYHKDSDQWFLQIECFDPHEPFFVPEKYREMYHCGNAEEVVFWPQYRPVPDDMTQEDLKNLRKEHAALISMCDYHLGRVLDFMDQNHMWDDTMLIVNTDHGFLLGERGLLGKNYMPMYDEIAHIPFYIHDPRNKEARGRRQALAQTMDIPATLMEYFECDSSTMDMDGSSLTPIIENDTAIHDTILYGVHGGHTQIFDGRYVLMKAPNGTNEPLVNITLMPTNMRTLYERDVLVGGTLVEGSRFTNDIPALKYFETSSMNPSQYGDLLFDMINDPNQQCNVQDEQLMQKMCMKLKNAMEKVQAPEEEFIRIGLR